jgi:hypothetical protein
VSFSTRPFRLIALLSALLLVLAACDSNGDDTDTDTEQAADSGVAEDPASALADAVAAMGDWDGVELSISFEADDTARASILEEDPDDAEMLELFLGASINIIAAGDDDSGVFQVGVHLDGTDVFELYMAATGDVIDDLALRVDLSTIAELADDPTMQQELDALVGQAAMFGLGDAAEALTNGDWVAIAGLDAMASMMGDFEEEQPDDAQVENALEALAERTEAFVTGDVDVSHLGTDAAGDRLRVVADGAALQGYLNDVFSILAANDLLEGMSPQELQDELEDIPADTEITLDMWVDGGELSQVAIDVAAIEDSEIDGEFLVIVALAEHSGDLTAPNAAATVDVMELFGQFMGDFAFDDFAVEDDGFDDDGFEDGGFDEELSQEDIDMMLSFMDCISEEDLEGFELFLPEVAEAAEQAIADGTLETC